MRKTLRIVGMTISVVLLMGIITACGNDDHPQSTPPVELLGTWSGSITDQWGSCLMIITFNMDNTGMQTIVEDGDVETLSFRYTVTGDILRAAELHLWGTDSNGDSEDETLIISVANNTLRMYVDENPLTLYREGSYVPDDPGDKGRDELSNTSWKLQSITGDASSASSEWKGEILKFGNKGEVIQIYNEGGSGSGTYTLSGITITFSSLPAWTNTWGSKFTYILSGNSLKLSDRFGSTFNFVKN